MSLLLAGQALNKKNLNTPLYTAYQRTIFFIIKKSCILDSLDLNVDQFENWPQNSKNLITQLGSAHGTSIIHFQKKSNKL